MRETKTVKLQKGCDWLINSMWKRLSIYTLMEIVMAKKYFSKI